MAKRFKMNLTTRDLLELGGTDSLPHPGNFPLGSVESRAAARALIAAGRFRPGDQGTFKCGCTYWAVSGDPEGHDPRRVIVIVWPANFRDLAPGSGHIHDYEIVKDKR